MAITLLLTLVLLASYSSSHELEADHGSISQLFFPKSEKWTAITQAPAFIRRSDARIQHDLRRAYLASKLDYPAWESDACSSIDRLLEEEWQLIRIMDIDLDGHDDLIYAGSAPALRL